MLELQKNDINFSNGHNEKLIIAKPRNFEFDNDMTEIWTRIYALPRKRKSYLEINLDHAKVNMIYPAKYIFIEYH